MYVARSCLTPGAVLSVRLGQVGLRLAGAAHRASYCLPPGAELSVTQRLVLTPSVVEPGLSGGRCEPTLLAVLG